MKLIAANDHTVYANDENSIELTNDADPRDVSLEGVARVQLNFPKFSDGRAFSQAFLLRRRLGFKGEIRATGDVLVDQLAQMKRSGFDVAVLRADQPLDVARRVLAAYPGYGVGKYQGDAVDVLPHFVDAATELVAA
ncbi:uncharacterized protein (DUF934 family) [Polaromonas sp. CG_9.5]|uniref:DUF934 domain-containing protein n=1 Tax=Polaromonas sp. CG_9.5 TaxID=3071705 RepID=UPI002E0889FC|nr:uncharacterized protein (DUF934 family) [Polaromonas sp. CG_9.5]